MLRPVMPTCRPRGAHPLSVTLPWRPARPPRWRPARARGRVLVRQDPGSHADHDLGPGQHLDVVVAACRDEADPDRGDQLRCRYRSAGPSAGRGTGNGQDPRPDRHHLDRRRTARCRPPARRRRPASPPPAAVDDVDGDRRPDESGAEGRARPGRHLARRRSCSVPAPPTAAALRPRPPGAAAHVLPHRLADEFDDLVGPECSHLPGESATPLVPGASSTSCPPGPIAACATFAPAVGRRRHDRRPLAPSGPPAAEQLGVHQRPPGLEHAPPRRPPAPPRRADRRPRGRGLRTGGFLRQVPGGHVHCPADGRRRARPAPRSRDRRRHLAATGPRQHPRPRAWAMTRTAPTTVGLPPCPTARRPDPRRQGRPTVRQTTARRPSGSTLQGSHSRSATDNKPPAARTSTSSQPSSTSRSRRAAVPTIRARARHRRRARPSAPPPPAPPARCHRRWNCVRPRPGRTAPPDEGLGERPGRGQGVGPANTGSQRWMPRSAPQATASRSTSSAAGGPMVMTVLLPPEARASSTALDTARRQ